MLELIEPFESAIVCVIILVITYLFASAFTRVFGKYIKYSTEVLENNPTNYQFLKHAGKALIYLIGIGWALYTLPAFKTIAGSILTGAGILAVVAGLASQHALSNIMSGIFIIIFKPFKVHDRLRIKDSISGIVEDITLRHTVIKDSENNRIIIPNTVISNEVIVNSDFVNEKICKSIDIPIAYDSDLLLAKSIFQEEAKNHKLQIDNRSESDIENGVPEIRVRVIGFGESSINLRAWVWAKNAGDAFVISCDLRERIKLRFDQELIEIPYPHRTIVHKERKTVSSSEQ